MVGVCPKVRKCDNNFDSKCMKGSLILITLDNYMHLPICVPFLLSHNIYELHEIHDSYSIMAVFLIMYSQCTCI